MAEKVILVTPDSIRIRRHSILSRIVGWITRIVIFLFWIGFPLVIVIDSLTGYGGSTFDPARFLGFAIEHPPLILALWGIFYGLLILDPSGYGNWKITPDGLSRTWNFILPLRRERIGRERIKSVALIKIMGVVPVKGRDPHIVAVQLDNQQVAEKIIFQTKNAEEARNLAQTLSDWWDVPFENQIGFNKVGTVWDALAGIAGVATFFIGGIMLALWFEIFYLEDRLRFSSSPIALVGAVVLFFVWVITLLMIAAFFFPVSSVNSRITSNEIYLKSSFRFARPTLYSRSDIRCLLIGQSERSNHTSGQTVNALLPGMLGIITEAGKFVILCQTIVSGSNIETIQRIFDVRCVPMIPLEPFGEYQQGYLVTDIQNRQINLIPRGMFHGLPQRDTTKWINYSYSSIERIDLQTVQNGAKVNEGRFFTQFDYTYCINITLGDGTIITTFHTLFAAAFRRPNPNNEVLQQAETTLTQLKQEIFGEQEHNSTEESAKFVHVRN